ncbi:hypothetical protein PVAND_005804 [Polypedilum vanderplanki]|uniref:Uncharacterized protein n=1 Tax=Polypedilum vanderplanki TaxID=319348 RepID=A0A9J6C2A9_POLVA|nr:hypothetical protein PVAND_005804 [Polypedilum vanderplanki]
MTQKINETSNTTFLIKLIDFNNKHSKIILKLSWIIIISLLFSGLIYYTYGAYKKWRINPDIATSIRQISSSNIPMPAITICQPTFPAEIYSDKDPMA